MRVGRGGNVWVYDGDGVHEVQGISSVHSRGEIHEMYDAVVNGKPVYHSGRWGMATAEAIFGMIESSQQRREVLVGFAQILDQLRPLPVRQREVYDPEVGFVLEALQRPTRLGERPRLRDHLDIGLLVEHERERLSE
jgi:hypothetical protein